MICPNCGRQVDDSSRYCPDCGSDIFSSAREREIYSNSAEKRIDNELRQLEMEEKRNNGNVDYMSDSYYSDNFTEDDNYTEQNKQDVTKIFDNSALTKEGYAPFAPDDIDEYGNEKNQTHRNLFIAVIICGSIAIIGLIAFAAILLGRSCNSGDAAVIPTSATEEISEPSAPTTATSVRAKVPDVLNEPESVAVNAIENRGLKASVIKQTSETVESGCVIAQNPNGGEMVEKGSTVVISVSLGPESTQEPDTETSEDTTTAETEASEQQTDVYGQQPTEPEEVTDEPPTEPLERIDTYILPESSSRYLDYTDLADINGFELMLARNEIYARHGRKFEDSEIQGYFDRCTWYHGTTEPEDFDEKTLNSYERANIDFILQKEYGNTQ